MDEEGARLELVARAVGVMATDLLGKVAAASAHVSETPEAQPLFREIETLLGDLGRLQWPVARGEVELGELLEGLIAKARAQPKWRNVQFEAVPTQGTAQGDARLIGRALDALVANAADACVAARGGDVGIDVAHHQEVLELIVRQTAPFPSADQLARVLRPDLSSTKRTSGFELGIPLALAAAQGGSLDARPASKEFVLRLPCTDR